MEKKRNTIIETWDDEYREQLKKKKQDSWKASSKLQKHAESTSKRRILEEQTKTEEQRRKFSENCSNAYWSRTEEEIKEHHKNHSIGAKRSYETNPELRKLRSETFGKCNTGKIYVNKEGKSKFIYPADLEIFLKNGWIKGRGKVRKQDLVL